MHKKASLLVVLSLLTAAILSACGDSTATPAATTAAATVAATTSSATTAAATTVAATTAAPTTVAATTAAATTAATTTAAATTAAVTTSAATTAAGGSTGNSTSAAFQLQPEPALPALPADAKKGGTFTSVSLSQLASTLHPYPSDADFTSSWQDVATYIFAGGLITYDYTTLKYDLSFAKDMTVSADAKTFTFTLKDGMKWSDGSAVTVADYQFAYDNVSKQDKATPENDFVAESDFLRMTSVKTDATTNKIVITLDQTYAPELAMTWVSALTPIPSKVWAGKPFRDATANSEILKPTVVLGPYMVQSYDPNSTGTLIPNPNYYKGVGNFEKIVLAPGAADTVVQAVKTGQASVAYNIPSASYAAAKKDPAFQIVDWTAANGSFRYMEFNTAHSVLGDKAVRQALSYAIDRSAVLKLADAGLGTPQFTFLPASSSYYLGSVNPYTYSIDTAKKTLSDAGYKLDGSGNLLGKDGKSVSLTVIYPTSSNPRKTIAAYLQQQYKQLGITVNVDGKDFQAYTQQLSNKDFDISLSTSGGGFPDPDTVKSFFKSAGNGGDQNHSGYSNPQVDKLFDQGSVEQDPTKRTDIYNQLQTIINTDDPQYFLYSLSSFSAFGANVKGVTPSKGDRLDYNDASLRWYFAQ